jgi:hypothetical protein
VYGNITGENVAGGYYIDGSTDYNSSHLYLTNSTVSYNNSGASPGSGNGVACGNDGWAEIKNCIFWGNGTDFFGRGNRDSLRVSYSICQNSAVNIPDLHLGPGNVQQNPLFADSANLDFHLNSGAGRWNPAAQTWVNDAVSSPAIDAGDPAGDFSLEPSPNGGRINLGRYGGTAEASKSGSVEIGGRELDGEPVFSLQCSPNPFYSSITIMISVRLGAPGEKRKASGVELGIYDLKGRLVQNFSPERFTRNALRVTCTWDAQNLRAGLYLARLLAGNSALTKTVLLLK